MPTGSYSSRHERRFNLVGLLRPATPADIQAVFGWRNDPWLVEFSTSQRPVTWTEHEEWFRRVLADERRLLFIVEPSPGVGGGTVRLERIDDRRGAVAIYLLRQFRGQRLGVHALVEACQAGFAQWPIETIHAYVREGNLGSLAAFPRAGFVPVGPGPECPGGHRELVLTRSDSCRAGDPAATPK